MADRATTAGFAIAVLAFLVYVSGALPAVVPLAELARYRGMAVGRFIAATGAPQGWAWLRLPGYGDALNLGAAAQLVVLAAAASGLLAAPG
jgi:hypothetical protein